MGEHCVIISSELLDSLVFPVSLHSVLLRSSIDSSGVREIYTFSSASPRSFCPTTWTPLLFDLHQCIRDTVGTADKQKRSSKCHVK